MKRREATEGISAQAILVFDLSIVHRVFRWVTRLKARLSFLQSTSTLTIINHGFSLSLSKGNPRKDIAVIVSILMLEIRKTFCRLERNPHLSLALDFDHLNGLTSQLFFRMVHERERKERERGKASERDRERGEGGERERKSDRESERKRESERERVKERE